MLARVRVDLRMPRSWDQSCKVRKIGIVGEKEDSGHAQWLTIDI